MDVTNSREQLSSIDQSQRLLRRSPPYHVGKQGAPKLLNSLLYKLTYFDFGKISTDVGKPTGYDRVRATEIGRKKYKLNISRKF